MFFTIGEHNTKTIYSFFIQNSFSCIDNKQEIGYDKDNNLDKDEKEKDEKEEKEHKLKDLFYCNNQNIVVVNTKSVNTFYTYNEIVKTSNYISIIVPPPNFI